MKQKPRKKSIMKKNLENKLSMNKQSTYKQGIYVFILILIHIAFLCFSFNGDVPMAGDEMSYYYSGLNLNKYHLLTNDRDGRMFREEEPPSIATSIAPGFPFIIFMILKFFGHDYIDIYYLRMMNLVFQALTFILLARILKFLKIREKIVVWTLGLYVFYPAFYYSNNRLLTEAPFTFFLLLSVYSFLKSREKAETMYYHIFNLSMMITICIRFNAVVVLVLCYLYTAIYGTESKNLKVKKLLGSMVYFIMFLIPLWIHFYMHLGQFQFFADSGYGAKYWGITPYFIDIRKAGNMSLLEFKNFILKDVDIGIYLRWRLFGIIQYLWGDFWDETLTHGILFLKPFIMLHKIILVPTFVGFIFCFNRKTKHEYLIFSALPLIFSMMYLPYHGLPRYLYPSIVYLFPLHAYLIQTLVDKDVIFEEMEWNVIQKIFFYLYKVTSVMFVCLLVGSVFVFPKQIKIDMMNYRLQKYRNTTIEEVQRLMETHKTSLPYRVEVDEGLKIRGSKYRNSKDSPLIFFAKEIPMTDSGNHVVSRLTIEGSGGYLEDRFVIYWRGSDTPEYTEDKVYSFPVYKWENKQIIYIDEDVSELLIVPISIKYGEYELRNIDISKVNVRREQME